VTVGWRAIRPLYALLHRLLIAIVLTVGAVLMLLRIGADLLAEWMDEWTRS
jgi:autotransporter translocation and assembly factor TamB